MYSLKYNINWHEGRSYAILIFSCHTHVVENILSHFHIIFESCLLPSIIFQLMAKLDSQNVSENFDEILIWHWHAADATGGCS